MHFTVGVVRVGGEGITKEERLIQRLGLGNLDGLDSRSPVSFMSPCFDVSDDHGRSHTEPEVLNFSENVPPLGTVVRGPGALPS